MSKQRKFTAAARTIREKIAMKLSSINSQPDCLIKNNYYHVSFCHVWVCSRCDCDASCDKRAPGKLLSFENGWKVNATEIDYIIIITSNLSHLIFIAFICKLFCLAIWNSNYWQTNNDDDDGENNKNQEMKFFHIFGCSQFFLFCILVPK